MYINEFPFSLSVLLLDDYIPTRVIVCGELQHHVRDWRDR